MAAELKDHFFKEVQSFKSPPPREVAPVPKVGEPAREHADSVLKLPKDKPTIIVFLRHCGCPCKHSINASAYKTPPPESLALTRPTTTKLRQYSSLTPPPPLPNYLPLIHHLVQSQKSPSAPSQPSPPATPAPSTA